MYLRPFYSTGLLFRVATDGDPAFLGTCFAYRESSTFVTAAHCVRGVSIDQLGITLPLIDHGDFIHVRLARIHAEADVAVLRTDEVTARDFAPFTGQSALHSWGEPVMALGYPMDNADDTGDEERDDALRPTARLFTGDVQRFFTFRSRGGYRYLAGELSFGAPGGLSGGPVFPTREINRVIGVVAENRNSTTYLFSETLTENGTVTIRERHHEVIRYGIFVSLEPLTSWLDAE